MNCTGAHRCKSTPPSTAGKWRDDDDKLYADAGWYVRPRGAALKYDGTVLCPLHRDAELEARILASVQPDTKKDGGA